MMLSEYDEQDALDAVYHDGHQTGIAEGIDKGRVQGEQIHAVSNVREWNKSFRQQVTKSACAQMNKITESVVDQIVQLISANPDWDNKKVAEAVQW